MSNIFLSQDSNNRNLSKLFTPAGREYNDMWLYMSADANKNLNSYRHWGKFAMIAEPLDEPGDFENLDGTKGTVKLKDVMWADKKHPFIGIKSLFNNVNAVGYNLAFQEYNNAPLLDNPKVRARIKERSDCSVKALVDATRENKMGRAVYNYSDFMFCKYLGQMSNNYLITLRRFAFPAGDHINYTLMGDNDNEIDMQQHKPDIGRLVTWMGTPGNEMSNILKYSFNMPWKKLTAELQDVQGQAENGGIMGTLLNMSSAGYREKMLKGQGGATSIATLQSLTQMMGPFKSLPLGSPPDDSWAYFKDKNKSYGPKDVITETHIRSGGDDGGLQFNQEITLTFDYELRSYDGINTKAAFMDLIGNILAVTYTTGTFWGGGFRQAGASQSNVFANLPIYNMKEPIGQKDARTALFESLKLIGQQWNNGQPINGFKDYLSAAKNIGQNVFQSLRTGIVAGLLNTLGRPQKQGFASLLTDAPVGLWHLTIGNPKHPILSMGNMILTNTSVEQYGPLGLDDFPTGLKVTLTLQHATPRDAMKIEQMYMMGDFRIYYPTGHLVENMYAAATELGGKTSTSESKYKSNSDLIAGGPNISNQLNTNIEDTTNIKSNSDIKNKRYMECFGMTSALYIKNVAMESYKGSMQAEKKESNQ